METAYYIINHYLSAAHWLSLLIVFAGSMAVFALLLSLGIELTQYVTCRGLCEIFDDVFGNTSGAVIGWYIGGVIQPDKLE